MTNNTHSDASETNSSKASPQYKGTQEMQKYQEQLKRNREVLEKFKERSQSAENGRRYIIQNGQIPPEWKHLRDIERELNYSGV